METAGLSKAQRGKYRTGKFGTKMQGMENVNLENAGPTGDLAFPENVMCV